MLASIVFFVVIELMILVPKYHSGRRWQYAIVFLVLVMVVGFRNYGGVDDVNLQGNGLGGYIGLFHLFENVGWNIRSYSSMEPSYFLFCELALKAHMGYKVVFLMYAILTFFFTRLSFSELCKTKGEWALAIGSFMCFCLSTYVSLMRQALAAAMILYAITLIMRGRTKPAIVMYVLSLFVHRGSIFAAIIFLVFSPRIRVKNWIKVAVPLVCLAVGASGVLNPLILLLEPYLPRGFQIYVVPRGLETAGSPALLTLVLFAAYAFQFVLDYVSVWQLRRLDRPRNHDGYVVSATTRNKPVYVETLERGELMYLSLYFVAISSGWASRVSVLLIVFTSFIASTFLYRFRNVRDKALIEVVCLCLLLAFFAYQSPALRPNVQGTLAPYSWSLNLRQDFPR